MDPIVVWLSIFLALAIVMFVAEVFVPSAGLLSVLGTVFLTIAIFLCFRINRWLGVSAMVAVVAIAPFAVALAVRVWQRTPIGKQMVLSSTVGELTRDRVLIGTEGVALTEMRPMGECEFGQSRVEAKSEMGRVIPAGRKVKVIEYHDTVATVREVETDRV